MRTGSQRRRRGFTYLWLVFVLAIGAAALGTAAQRWSLQVARDRERELLFRGQAIADAIASYRRAAGGKLPRGLEDLVEDRRGAVVRRHLRRAYDDPFTRRPDWEPILAPDGGWLGVRSRATVPSVLPPPVDGASDAPHWVADHLFLASAPAPSLPASAPDSQPPSGPFGSRPGFGVKQQSPPTPNLPPSM
jgi:type II secretory pathway pseudopilin PulG